MNIIKASDFRIVEYNGSFNIQRKKLIKKTKGFLFWKENVEYFVWKDVDIHGNPIFTLEGKNFILSNSNIRQMPLNTMGEAIEKINTIIAGKIIHYIN